MKSRMRNNLIVLFVFTLSAVSLSACARKEGPERVVATINDYKMTDASDLKKCTKGSKDLIDSTFKYLYENGKSIILRCPIIPKINYNDEHLKAICDLSLNYPKLECVELLPYHNYGVGKSTQINYEYQIPEIKSIDDKQSIERLREDISKYDSSNIILRGKKIK